MKPVLSHRQRFAVVHKARRRGVLEEHILRAGSRLSPEHSELNAHPRATGTGLLTVLPSVTRVRTRENRSVHLYRFPR